MLFNLLLASITIVFFFSYFLLVVFSNFFMIPVEIENGRLKLGLTIPTCALKTVANDVIEMLLVLTDKTINDLSKQSKEAIYLLSLLPINYLSLISATK